MIVDTTGVLENDENDENVESNRHYKLTCKCVLHLVRHLVKSVARAEELFLPNSFHSAVVMDCFRDISIPFIQPCLEEFVAMLDANPISYEVNPRLVRSGESFHIS